MNEAEGNLGIEFSGILSASGCRLTRDNVSFVLDSDPGLNQSGSLTIAMETFSVAVNAAVSGPFGWQSGTRTGNCTLDNTVTADLSLMDISLDGAVPTATVSGSVCGHTVNREINLAMESMTSS